MWYIFPQLKALGFSDKAVSYGIEDIDEAKAYMKEPYLRKNLIEITKELLKYDSSDLTSIMSDVDCLKLRSCMTLFEIATPDEVVFGMVLDKFYDGNRDRKTLQLLEND